MADDSLEVIEELDFHPCDTPRGTQYYDINSLTPEQQEKLNDLKTKMIREDEIYLAEHPEVRAIIVLILRHVFKHQPRTNVNMFIANYFMKDRDVIENEIDEYLTGRTAHIYRGDSCVLPDREISGESLVDVEKLELQLATEKRREELEIIAADVLSEIIENILSKIETEEQDNSEYIRKLITEEIVDKVGDRYREDFKNFIIEEILKRIVSDRDVMYEEDLTFEDFMTEDFMQDFDFEILEPMPAVDDQETLVSWEIEERAAKKAAEEHKEA